MLGLEWLSRSSLAFVVGCGGVLYVVTVVVVVSCVFVLDARKGLAHNYVYICRVAIWYTVRVDRPCHLSGTSSCLCFYAASSTYMDTCGGGGGWHRKRCRPACLVPARSSNARSVTRLEVHMKSLKKRKERKT